MRACLLSLALLGLFAVPSVACPPRVGIFARSQSRSVAVSKSVTVNRAERPRLLRARAVMLVAPVAVQPVQVQAVPQAVIQAAPAPAGAASASAAPGAASSSASSK